MRALPRRTFLRAAALSPLVAACSTGPSQSGGVPPIPNTDVNHWGVNTFLHLDAERWRKQKTLELAARAGIGWIKQHFPWEDIEQTGRGQFVDPFWKVPTWAKYDEIVELAEAAKLRVIARVDRTPAWARRPGSTPTTPPVDMDLYGDFIKAVVRRYRGKISHYQIWNEPNLSAEWGGMHPNAGEYVELLKTAHAAASEADPEVVILDAPLAQTLERSARAWDDLDFLQMLYDEGAADFFHIHSANAFGLAFPPETAPDPAQLNFRRVELQRGIMEANGDSAKAVWFNEYGWNASPTDFPSHLLVWGRVSDQEQAEWTVRGVEFGRQNWPWAGVFNIWFMRRGFADLSPTQSEYYFRMVDPDFTPRPLYRAVAKAATGR